MQLLVLEMYASLVICEALKHSLYILQNLLALDPKWLTSSEARALSPRMAITGATINTCCFKQASYSNTPFTICFKSSSSGLAISSAEIRGQKLNILEHSCFSDRKANQSQTPIIKFVPFFGAISTGIICEQHQTSNTGYPAAVALKGCCLINSMYSCYEKGKNTTIKDK